jgi:hypothetical protein
MKVLFQTNYLRVAAILVVMLISFSGHAAKRYWISAATSTWNTTANWSTSSGGAGGSSVPGSNDTAYFDGSGLGRCDIDANVNVKRFDVASGFNDTITQNAYAIAIGSSGMIVSGGVFIGSSSSITLSSGGDYNNSGCNFTSTSGTFDIQAGDLKLTGTGSFTHNNGLVKLSLSSGTDTCTIDFTTSSSPKSLYNLELQASGSTFHRFKFGTGNVITVDNDLTVTGTGSKTVGAGIIEIKKNATISGTGTFSRYSNSSAGTLKFTGTTSQTLTGNGNSGSVGLIGIEIAKSDTLHLVGTMASTSDWKLASGILDAGTSKLYMISIAVAPTFTGRFTGTSSFNKLFLDNGTNDITINDTICVNDTIKVSNGSVITKGTNAGVLWAKGHFIAHGSNNVSGTATLLINGSGTQYYKITGSPALSILRLKIEKSSSDTLYFSGKIKTRYSWTYTSGIVNTDNAHIHFNNFNQSITGTHTLKKVHFDFGSAAFDINIASGSVLTVNDSLWFDGDSYGSMDGIINAKGAITVTNNSTLPGQLNHAVGNGVIKINGTGDQSFSGASSISTMQLPGFEIDKASGTLSLSNYIVTCYNWTYVNGTINPGTSTVMFSRTNTISGTHSLNNVTLYGSLGNSGVTISSGTTLTCNGSFVTTGTTAISVATGTIEAKGDISIQNTNTGGGGSGTLLINGTGTQNFSGNSTAATGNLCKVTINKTAGVLNLSGVISVKNNWTYTAGATNAGSSTLAICATSTVTGTDTLNNLTLAPTAAATVTIASGTTLHVNGTLTLAGGTNALTINTGAINANGNVAVSNLSTSSLGGGTATINIVGTGTQSLTGSGTFGTGFLPRIVIDKSSTLTLYSWISSNQDWTYTSGTVAADTSTVWFRGAFNLDGQGTSTTMSFNKVVFGGSTTRTLTGNLIVKSNLTINASSTLSAGSNFITLGGSWINNGIWTAGTSTLKIDGSGYQSINKASAALETFPNVTMVKPGGSLTLNCPTKITTAFNLYQGKIRSTAANYLEFSDNLTYPEKGSDTGYVSGPIRKTGNDAFTFPLGDTLLTSGAYHPLEISAPSSAADQFEGCYYATEQTVGDSLADTLERISTCEYWKLNRTVGSSNVQVTISWNSNSCDDDDFDNMRVAVWDGTMWTDQGGTNLSINGVTGLISSNGQIPVTSSTWITNSHLTNSDPFAIVNKKLDGGYHRVTNGKLLFKFDEEYNDVDQKLSYKIYDDLNRLVSSSATVPVNLQKPVVYGSNRYLLNIMNCGISSTGYLGNGFYVLEITNEKGEKWYLQFKHTVTITPTCP